MTSRPVTLPAECAQAGRRLDDVEDVIVRGPGPGTRLTAPRCPVRYDYPARVSPWIWFVIAGLAAVAGVVLLAADYGHRTAHQRARRRWAVLRGWRFVGSDPVLVDRWRHGLIARGGAGVARNLVLGSLFTPQGRRPVHIFDHEQSGKISGVLVAVRRRVHANDLVVELWTLTRQRSHDPGLEPLGNVGDRTVYTTDPDRTRPLLTQELADVCADVGQDVRVLWLEQDWVLAAAPPTATPARLELLLRALNALADQLDTVTDTDNPADSTEPSDRTQH
ncbi:MAG: hypothetical protein ACRDTG_01040 [Pseudonocardiaceae bacterium]